jgi:hypothetical protein
MTHFKELPCRRCGHVWKWSLDKKDTPYCPEGYGCRKEEKNIPKRSLGDILSELSEIQEDIEKQTEADMDEWWNGLSKDDQMKAFYSVMKRLVDGELKQKGSYRYVLYEVFGFDSESYMLGMMCGYMELHNSIKRDVEKFT